MNTDSITIRVLVVDDQPSDVELLKHGFASAGGNVDVVHIGDAGRAKTFVSLLAPFAFDLIVLDWNLGGTQAEDIAEAYFVRPVWRLAYPWL